MSRDLFWLSYEQWNRIEPHLPTDVAKIGWMIVKISFDDAPALHGERHEAASWGL